jgi:hypothetical protein
VLYRINLEIVYDFGTFFVYNSRNEAVSLGNLSKWAKKGNYPFGMTLCMFQPAIPHAKEGFAHELSAFTLRKLRFYL